MADRVVVDSQAAPRPQVHLPPGPQLPVFAEPRPFALHGGGAEAKPSDSFVACGLDSARRDNAGGPPCSSRIPEEQKSPLPSPPAPVTVKAQEGGNLPTRKEALAELPGHEHLRIAVPGPRAAAAHTHPLVDYGIHEGLWGVGPQTGLLCRD